MKNLRRSANISPSHRPSLHYEPTSDKQSRLSRRHWPSTQDPTAAPLGEQKAERPAGILLALTKCLTAAVHATSVFRSHWQPWRSRRSHTGCLHRRRIPIIQTVIASLAIALAVSGSFLGLDAPMAFGTANAPTTHPLSAAPASATSLAQQRPATTQPSTPAAPSRPNTDSATEPSLHITSLGSATLAAHTDLSITIEITNPTQETLHMSWMDINAQSTTIITNSQMYRWFNGSSYPVRLYSVNCDLTVNPYQSLHHTIVIPYQNLPWSHSEFGWGPRGIEVAAYTDDWDQFTDRSIVITTPENPVTPTLTTATVPVIDTTLSTMPTAVQYAFNSDSRAESTWNTDRDNAEKSRNNLVKSWDMAGVSFLADPQFSVKPQYSQVYPLPTYDIDLMALADAGRITQAEDFARNAVYLPWDTPSDAAIRAARDLHMTILASDQWVTPADTLTYTPDAHGSVFLDKNIPVVVSNNALSQAVLGNLSDPSGETIKLDSLDTQQAAIALSAMQYRQLPNKQRSVVIELPRNVDTDTAKVVREVLASPWVKPASLSDITDRAPSPEHRDLRTRNEANLGELLADQLQNIDHNLSMFQEFAAIFPGHGTQYMEYAQHQARTLLAVSWREHPNLRLHHSNGLLPSSRELNKIEVTASSTINLISESSALPIVIRNRFDEPVNVVVTLTSQDNRLRAPKPISATLAANTTTSVSVPVNAHGSGNVSVRVELTNTSGQVVGTPHTLTIRVRADWEHVGTLVITTVVGCIFILGLIKSVRRGRRSQPIAPEEFVAAQSDRKRRLLSFRGRGASTTHSRTPS
ncbi:DUF6049 family protein [Trueperella sp. LYQ143]|uniref:DUF6049 family protein n=1 Tax=Trueperella sp. LYQ143 TaxID=3391059 RepID=UPI00398389DF